MKKKLVTVLLLAGIIPAYADYTVKVFNQTENPINVGPYDSVQGGYTEKTMTLGVMRFHTYQNKSGLNTESSYKITPTPQSGYTGMCQVIAAPAPGSNLSEIVLTVKNKGTIICCQGAGVTGSGLCDTVHSNNAERTTYTYTVKNTTNNGIIVHYMAGDQEPQVAIAAGQSATQTLTFNNAKDSNGVIAIGINEGYPVVNGNGTTYTNTGRFCESSKNTTYGMIKPNTTVTVKRGGAHGLECGKEYNNGFPASFPTFSPQN